MSCYVLVMAILLGPVWAFATEARVSPLQTIASCARADFIMRFK
jgi:hypothetical protein